MPDIIKPKRATKSVADKSDKVLEKDELLLISPNTGSGTGRYGVKIGDGATATKDLPYAIDGEKADEMIVSEFTKESNENPVLSPGDKIKTLCGKLLKKFTYIETLLGKKVNTSDIYDGTDSSSTTKVATANSVRQVNEKADNNTNQLNQLNSNISSITFTINPGLRDILDPLNKSGVYDTNPETINLPLHTYGRAIISKNPEGLWIFVEFLPTDLSAIYFCFYNGYSHPVGWSEWKKISSQSI